MTGYAVALILGSLLPLAFAPFDIWPLAIAIPIALLYLFEKQRTAKQTFVMGWLVGLGYFGFGVYRLAGGLPRACTSTNLFAPSSIKR